MPNESSGEGSMFCPSCGRENPSLASFCGGCGVSLETARDISPAVAAIPEMAAVRYAGFWMRLGAWLIDWVIIWFALGVFRTLGFLDELSPTDLGVRAVLAVLGVVLPLGYYVALTGLKGQTVGKMSLRIKVVNVDGKVPGLGYAALREIVGKIVSGIMLLLGFLWIAWDPRKRGWHDYIAGTRVVKVRT